MSFLSSIQRGILRINCVHNASVLKLASYVLVNMLNVLSEDLFVFFVRRR